MTKQKDRKKTKKNKLSIDEFCGTDFSYYNEYQMRLNRLQENKRFIEGDQACWSNLCENERIPDLDPTRPFHIPEGLRNDPYTLETVLQSFDSPSDSETTKNIKETIYSFLEQILSYKGPLHINDPELTQELETFPVEAKQIIEQNGGFKNFLLKSMRFAQVKDYVCVIDDVVKAYDLPSKASIVQNYNTAHDLDSFELGYSSECKSEGVQDHVCNANLDDCSSFLNPDAVEYKPVKYQNHSSSNLNIENNSFDCDKNNLEGVNKICETKSLLSLVSKLRQPILNSKNEPVENHISEGKLDLCESVNSSIKLNRNESVEDIATTTLTATNTSEPLKATSVCEARTVCKEEYTVAEVARKVYHAAQLYFSDKITKEARIEVDYMLRPYAIIEVPKKLNKCVQSSMPEVEKVSQCIMTENDDLQKAIELADSLLVERDDLIMQKMQLEETLTITLDSETKYKKKSTVDISSLRKELEDAKLDSQTQKGEFINKQTQWENEQKRLNQHLNKSLEDALSCKKEIDEMRAENKRLETEIKDFQNRFSLVEIEKESLRKSHDLLEAKTEAIQAMKEETLQMEQRAKSAELNVLRLKKSEYLKRIDDKTDDAIQKIKELHDGVSRFGGNLTPYFVTGFKALLIKLNDYINGLYASKKEFLVYVDKQIKEVEKGTPLNELKTLQIQDLPEIPSLTSIYPNSNTAFALPNQDNSTINNNSNSLQNPLLLQAYNSVLPQNIGTNIPKNDSSLGSQTANPNLPQSVSNSMLHAYNYALPANSTNNNLGSLAANMNIALPVANSANMLQSTALPNPYCNYPTGIQLPTKVTTTQIPPGMQFGLASASVNLQSLKNPLNSAFVPTSTPASTSKSSEPQEVTMALKKTCPPNAVTIPSTSDEIANKEPVLSLSGQSESKDTTGASRYSSNSSLIETASVCSESISTIAPIELGYSISKEKLEENVGVTPIEHTYQNIQTKVKQKRETKNSYEKLLAKLQMKYPNLSQSELMEFVKEFRKRRNNKLSGLTVDMIVMEVGNIIESQCRPSTPTHNKAKFRPTVLVNKSIVPLPTSKVCPSEKATTSQECPWANTQSCSSSQWSGDSADKSCIICYEDMTDRNAYKVDCGHRFHLKCIREWLNKTSNCPICRVHLLLPEDYPSLS